jgi:hypothetical protein
MSLWKPACRGLFPRAGESDRRKLPRGVPGRRLSVPKEARCHPYSP